jgi:hypothetical protein
MTTSLARTVYLVPPQTVNEIPVGFPISTSGLAWPPKDPTDTLDFTLDAEWFLNDITDTINTGDVTIAVTPEGITSANPVFTTSALTWDFSGGTSGVIYTASITFQTIGGLTVHRTVNLPVATL